MKKFLGIFLSVILFLSACNSNGSQSEKGEKAISIIIEELKKSNSLEKDKVDDLIATINDFAKKNPNHVNTPKHLEMKAKYLSALGKNADAILVYKNIYSNYKDYENNSDALFMMAFLTENNLNDKEKAIELYSKYMNEFPKGEFFKDAKFSIDNIYKTPEELMQMFKKKAEIKE